MGDPKAGNERPQSEILFAATMQALLLSLLAEIERGITIDEMRGLMQDLLHCAKKEGMH